MFKVGDRGKTRGGQDYEVVSVCGSWGVTVNVDDVEGLYYDKETGRAPGIGAGYDLMPPDREEVEMPEYSTINTSYGRYSLTELLIFAAEAARDNPGCTFYVDAEAGTISVHAD